MNALMLTPEVLVFNKDNWIIAVCERTYYVRTIRTDRMHYLLTIYSNN